ncbi:hypothetical protein LSH36_50g07026 [Paralvinella palmiformis]|uniref:SHSP domain-containing protein n=1 Tax=Paralvinella palmiformis TaxID=53620 RepID=A0AAD9K5U1_9ANNE|nr:hypothetical protein LSH36_50g07026 [Paralvinella palmiformis]
MNRERHMHITRTTELPTKTYHITKHHFTPIRYEPGVEVIRKPTIEHKVITSGTGISGDMTSTSHGHGGPRRKETIQIFRSPTATYADVGGYGPREVKKVVKVVGGGVIGDGLMDQVSSSSVSSGYAHPESFVTMQKTMEGELDRRRVDWEREVEKMQHGFFDMKTSDAASVRDKMADVDVRSRSGEILTVGDSHDLFHELADGSRVYRQKFDLYGFDTDNLMVRAEDGKLTISASKEEQFGGATSLRQFKRTVDIPEVVDPEQISSFLGEDGILTIEAPVVESRVKQEVRYDGRRAVASSSTLRHVDDDVDFPPGFDAVVETTNSRSNTDVEFEPTSMSPSMSSSTSTSFARRRYLGPDVEETPYGRKLKTSLYIGRKYKADDVTVKLYDYKINVDARSEEIVAGRTSKRQFTRDIDIPGPVDRASFRAVFGADGRLYIGGSFTGNDDHDAVTGSVESDMPSGGKSVNIMY